MADMDLNYQGDSVSGVEPAKKRKGAVIGGVTAGALAVAVGGGAAAYALSDVVKNQVKLTISKPESYYTWVTEKNSSELATQISEAYRTYLEEAKKGTTSNVSLKFDTSEDLRALIGEYMTDLPEINSIVIGCNSKELSSIINADIFAEVNGKNVISAELAADYEASDVVMRLPELSEQWISMSDEVGAENVEIPVNDPEKIITPDELESLIIKYTNLYNDCISDVEIEKKEEVAIGDITVKYTVAETTFTPEQRDEISEKFLSEMKNDELIKSILVDRSKTLTEEQFNDEFDSAIESLKDDSESDSATITFKTYIDATGSIRGFSSENSELSEECVRLILGKQDSAIRGEFVVSGEDPEDDSRMDITLTEKKGKSYDGTITLDSADSDATIDITDLTVVDEKKGYLSGNILISADEQKFAVALSSDEKSQIISSDIVVDETNYGKLTITFSNESGAEVSNPDKSGAYDVYAEDADFPKDYVDEDTMVEFAKNVLLNVGLDEALAEEYAISFGESIYYTYEDWEDDWGDDEWSDEDFGELEWSDEDWSDDDLFWDESDLEENPYADDMVIPEFNDAYITIADGTYMATYNGFADSLSYNAKLANITGKGKYTLAVSADTDGYKEHTNNVTPEGFWSLGFEAYGDNITKDMEIKVTSLKIDGKEYELAGEPYVEIDDGYFIVTLYNDEDYSFEEVENAIELGDFGEWTDVEISFELL